MILGYFYGWTKIERPEFSLPLLGAYHFAIIFESATEVNGHSEVKVSYFLAVRIQITLTCLCNMQPFLKVVKMIILDIK